MYKQRKFIKNNLMNGVACFTFCMLSFSLPVMSQTVDYSSLMQIFDEPVTTSATGKPQRVSEAPVTMEILTQDDIRRSGAVSIPEVLRHVNGVNVVQKSSNTYDISIRGYNQHASQRLLVLVNGRQVYLDHYGYTDWASIPVQLDEIEQIEVVKGPSTALFGFNAVNGVVNIVTYNPLYDDVSSVGVTGGTGNFYQGSFVHTQKFTDQIASRLSVSKMKGKDFNNSLNSAYSILGSNSVAEYISPESFSFNIDTALQVTDKSQLRAEFSHNANRSGGVTTTGINNNNRFDTRSGKISYVADTAYGLINANIYKNFLVWDLTSTNGTISPFNNQVFVAQLEDTIEVSTNHTVRVSGEYRDNSLTGRVINRDNSEVSYEVFALSGMWDWKINDEWTWNNAARVDHVTLGHKGPYSAGSTLSDAAYDHNLTEYSYNSGIVWRPSKVNTFRLNTGRGLKIPSLTEYGLDIFAIGLAFNGVPSMDPEVFTNYELAWDYRVSRVNGVFRSSVFYNETENATTARGVLDGVGLFSANVGDSKSYGVELSLEGKYSENFDWGIGYIYQETEDSLSNGQSGSLYTAPREYEEGNPEHHLNVKLGYKKDGWEANGLLYYVSSSKQFTQVPSTLNSYATEDIDGYVGANARIAYTFGGDVTVAVSGQQLLRSRTQTSVSPDVDRRVFLSLSKKF